MTSNIDSNKSVSIQVEADNTTEIINDSEIVYLNLDKNISMIKELQLLKTDFRVFENEKSCDDYIRSIRDHTIILIVTGQNSITYSCIWLNMCLCPMVTFIYTLIKENAIFHDVCKQHQSLFYFYASTSNILKSHLEKLSSNETIVIYDQYHYLKEVSENWHIFETFDLCLNATQETFSKQSVIFVLVLEFDYSDLYDYLTEDLTSLFLKNISSVLIVFRSNESNLNSLSRKKYLIRQVNLYVNEIDIIQQYERDKSKMTHYQTINNDDQQISLCSIRRRKFQLLVEFLAAMPPTEESYQELINECRMRYKKNNQQLAKIDEFEKDNFGINNPIGWYTRDAFIYRLLNEASRSESLNLIYTFRSFVSDLYKQLESLKRPTGEIHVYRGQLMSLHELNILQSNIEECFFTNTFLSTTSDCSVALIFSGYEQERAGVQSVLFDYKLDTSVKSKPFANISQYSYIRDENEVLISMGTMFRLNSLEFDENLRLWYVQLTLCEYDEKLNDYCSLFRRDTKTTPILLLFGEYLEDQNAFDDAEYFYRLHLENQNAWINQIHLQQTYKGIARVCQNKGQYAAAIENLNIAWNHCAEDDHRSRSEILLLKAEVFKKSNCLNDALNVYNQLNEIVPMPDNERAKVNTEIGDIYIDSKHWSKAIDVLNKALDLLHTIKLNSEKRLRSRIKANLKIAQFGIEVERFSHRRTKPLFFIRTFYQLVYQNIQSLLIIIPFYFFIYSIKYDHFIFNVIFYLQLLFIGHYFSSNIVRWIDRINYKFCDRYRRTFQPYISRFVSGVKTFQTIFFIYGLIFLMTEIHYLIRMMIMFSCFYYSSLLRPCFIFISMQFIFQLYSGSTSFIVGYLFMFIDAFIQSILQLYIASQTTLF